MQLHQGVCRVVRDDIHWAQSQNRIVQHAGRRFALRLEQGFWDVLERIARLRHQRIGTLIAALAADYDTRPGGLNFSSYLRSFALADLQRELVRQDAVLNPYDIIDILRGCPAPGLIMQRDRIIVEFNTALSQWLGDGHPPLRQHRFDAIFEPRVTRPLDDTMELLYDGRLKRTPIQIAYHPPSPLLPADAEPAPAQPPRSALATLHGLYNPEGSFYCLAWFTGGPALQMRTLK